MARTGLGPDAAQLRQFLNPKPSALLAIAWGTLLRFVIMMFVVFTFYSVIFAWARLEQDSCVEVANARGESYYWLQRCLQLREQ